MAALTSYSTGTISIGAGATSVVGVGSIWTGGNVFAGDTLVVAGHEVTVLDVVDATHLTIEAWPYSAVTAGSSYKTYKNSPLRVTNAQIATQTASIFSALASDGYFYYVDSTETVPDPSLGDDGQYAFKPTTGEVWLKTGGVWVLSSFNIITSGVMNFSNTTEATGVGTTFAARFAGGVEFAKKVFIAGAVAIGSIALANAQSALTITATQPTTPVATQNAIALNITGAGSASITNNALVVSYAAGYTGSSVTRAGQFVNDNAGTGNNLIVAANNNTPIGNIGASANTSGSTTGLNIGLTGLASAGDINAGVVGIAQLAKNSAKNIGVVGSAINTGTSPVQIGGWFSLNQTTVPTVSAALIADNGAQTDPIFRARDNGTDVFVIADGGTVQLTNTTASSSTTTGALTVGGGVGVGGALNVAGVSSAAGLSSSSYVRAADGASIGWGAALSATIVGNSSADIFVFYTASTERMRVTNTQISISPTTASSSTTTGALIVGGGVGVGGALNVAGVSNLRGNVGIGANVAPDSLLTVNANTALPVTLVNPGTHFVGADAMFHFLTIDTFGGNAGMQGRRANGTLAAKTAVTAGTVLLQNSGAGWNGAAYTGGAVTFVIVAAETFTNTSGVATANGAYARINTTPIGSTTSTEAVRFQPSGGVSIGATAIATDPGIGSLNITNNLSVLGTTASSSTTTGALIVGGGVGVGGSIYAGASIIGAGIYSTGAMKCSHPTAGLGYDTGAGGTVTQATSKSTGVSLSKVSGQITMNAAALAAATIVSFVLTNTAIAATDTLVINHVSGGTPGAYGFNAQCAAGSATINVRNNTAGSLSEAIVLQFNLIKGVTS